MGGFTVATENLAQPLNPECQTDILPAWCGHGAGIGSAKVTTRNSH